MIFFNRKSNLIKAGFFKDFTDFHNHILPGVDDGVKLPEESLEVLTFYENLGVSKVIFTPHVMSGMQVEWEDIVKTFNNFAARYKGKIELGLGAEYMLDLAFEKRIGGGLQHLCEDWTLVETSYFSPPNNLYELLYDVSLSGCTPVIAHPERYLFMRDRDYEKLKNNDYLLQLNLLSLTGYYGKQVMKRAETLLEKEMYDLVGTDLHNLGIFTSWVEKFKPTREQLAKLERIKAKTM